MSVEVTGWGRRAAGKLLVALAAVCTLAMAPAAGDAAAAGPVWEIDSAHGPHEMAPGGSGQYVIESANVGDAATDGTPVTMTVDLPDGVMATAAEGLHADAFPPPPVVLVWICPGLPANTVSCTLFDPLVGGPATVTPRGAVAERHGGTPVLTIDVDVDPSASGEGESVATIAGGGAAPASATDKTPFGAGGASFGFLPDSFAADFFDAEYPAGSEERQAGSHPFELRVDFRTRLRLSHGGSGEPFTTPQGNLRTIVTRLPVGFVGNPEAAPRCANIDFVDVGPANRGRCPTDTQVGTIRLLLNNSSTVIQPDGLAGIPVFNVVPPPGAVAAFGFSYLGVPTYIVASLDPEDHSVIATIDHVFAGLPVRGARLTLWGVPADPAHDGLRQDDETGEYGASAETQIRPFLTLPTQCETGDRIEMDVASWRNPDDFEHAETSELTATGCDDPRMRFEPEIAIQPTSQEAASPTGLKVDLHVPQKVGTATDASEFYASGGSDKAIVTPHLRDAVTRLPEGMAINPSAADGLLGCSEEDVGLDDNEAPHCPDASKIGTVEIDSPLVPDTLEGFIYQAKQSENPHGSLLGFYTVARGNGLTIKLAARVDADPETGRLTTTYLDNPQLAFEHYRLHFWGGDRAPLVNPPTCGEFTGSGTFTSWNSSVPAVTDTDVARIASGPGGGPCPNGLGGRPFAPEFRAGSAIPLAGAFAEFALEVSRGDGYQELRGLETTLPPGVLAKLAGVPYCPESALASISGAAGTGFGERLEPSCPAASRVGSSDAAAGAGSRPFHNPGDVYLTGPYKGAPLGLAVVTPIVAGPLDLGSIVVRAALHVDPVTTRVKVVSDPIPDKLVVEGNGLPLNVRSVRVAMDRPRFTLNPSSCAEMAVGATLTSLQGAVAHPSARFQVGACAALGFKPRLFTRLFGGNRRGGHPELRTVLQMPSGANIRRAAVSLPRSVILDQGNIRTVCTRVQFVADACPKGSIYGRAAASSPLVDYVLRGPVYLRSSDNPLPDLVAVLRGPAHQPIEIELAGRIDSVRGGIRTVFPTVPDAAVEKFVLTMKGGKRQGLLQSTRNLCRGAGRAFAGFRAHNGRADRQRPRLKVRCGKGRTGKAKRRARSAHRR